MTFTTGLPAQLRVPAPTGVEIKQLRNRLGLSQSAFATQYGFSVISLRKWEQQRAVPEQSSVLLLRMIEIDADQTLALVNRVAQKFTDCSK